LSNLQPIVFTVYLAARFHCCGWCIYATKNTHIIWVFFFGNFVWLPFWLPCRI